MMIPIVTTPAALATGMFRGPRTPPRWHARCRSLGIKVRPLVAGPPNILHVFAAFWLFDELVIVPNNEAIHHAQ